MNTEEQAAMRIGMLDMTRPSRTTQAVDLDTMNRICMCVGELKSVALTYVQKWGDMWLISPNQALIIRAEWRYTQMAMKAWQEYYFQILFNSDFVLDSELGHGPPIFWQVWIHYGLMQLYSA